MEEKQPARAGDTIRRMSDGQEFVAATDEENGMVYTAGWPAAREEMKDFEVTKRADDRAHRKMLESVSKGSHAHDGGGGRRGMARTHLAELEMTELLEKFRKLNPTGVSGDIADVTKWAHDKGWDIPAACVKPGDPYQNTEPEGINIELVATKLMLIVTEIAEAMEELRKGEGHINLRIDDETKKPEGFIVELADAYIRMVHLCGMLGLDLETAIQIKKTFNITRSHRHGGKKA